MSTAALILTSWKVNGQAVSADIVEAVDLFTVRETITGASTIDAELDDPKRVLLRSSLFSHSATSEIDDAGFELVKIAKSGTKLTTTWEDMAVAELRKKTGTKVVGPGTMSRAQFCASLCREVPWVKVVAAQGPKALVQLARGLVTTTAVTTGATGGWGSFGLTSTAPSIASGPATTMSVGEVKQLALNAGFTASQAPIMAAIAQAESQLNPNAHNTKPPDDSYGLWQINLYGGLGPQRRRDLHLNADSDLFTPAVNAAAAKYVFDQQGLRAWSTYSSGAYSKYLAGAQNATATGTSGAGLTKSQTTKDDEDSWSAMSRIMGEIGWRVFCYRGTVYIVPDNWLISHPLATYTLSESSPGVDVIDLDWDVGKPAATATITAWAGYHDLFPGCVVNLQNMGVGDGAWLVETIERTAASKRVTVTCLRPQPTFAEPTDSTATGNTGDGGFGPSLGLTATTGNASESAVAEQFVQAALTAKGKPYLMGATGPDRYDCSGLVQWAARRVGVSLPRVAEAQRKACTPLSVQVAIATRGALLFRDGEHVAISLGDGTTMEARGKAYGCGIFSATVGRAWTTGGMAPGIPLALKTTADGRGF